MTKPKYYYNTQTCKYERVKLSKIDVLLNSLGIFSIGLLIAVSLVLTFYYYFESPKEIHLKNEVDEMKFYYENLQREVSKMESVLVGMEIRDDNIYRAVLGAEPINEAVREAGIGGSDRYEDIRQKKFDYKDQVVQLNMKIDKLRRKLYIESRSHDEIVRIAKKKEKTLASIPAVRPISNRSVLSLASGYGMRIHPIYKIRKMHLGLDFSSPVGTPIYATADGRVKLVRTRFSGYGKVVEIDHENGYVTRYAHMHGFAVKKGQRVKRGVLIGYVGSTGLSTAPHVHYEVIHKGKQVNPIHHILGDVSTEDYEKIIELASIENQSLGM